MFKAYGIGRFVSKPTIREVGETCVCQFSLAFTSYRGKGENRKEEVDYFDFVAWDTGARVIEEYCDKGDLISIVAQPRNDRWEDKETGKPRQKTLFRVEEFKLIGRTVGKAKSEAQKDKTENEGPPF